MSNSTIDQQFIEFVVKTIVGNPDAVQIERTIDEKGVLLQLTVDPEDLGRVIGKRGSGAQALRTLLRALGTKNDARYNLKIVDVGDGEGRPGRRRDEEDSDAKPQKEKPEEPKVTDEEPDSPAEQPEAPVEEAKEEVHEDDEQDDSSDRAAKTRRELADLDDLDI